MQTKITGVIDVFFIRSGVGKESGKPYLQVSNGEEAHFLKLDCPVEEFSHFKRMDQITIKVERDFFSNYEQKVLEVVS